MIVNQDIRGMQAWATMSKIKSNKDAMGNMRPPISKIREKMKTPFTGLTTDMRGRDLLGYAACKSFNATQTQGDIMSSRLVNPNPKFEMYSIPKKRVFLSALNIKPSELDMLTHLRNDNAKMLIIQILKSKQIGIEHLQGNPGQRVRLLKAYNDLCSKYELEYTRNRPGAVFLLQEYENQFKREVQNIFGVPYDDLNRPADANPALQQILRAIQDNAQDFNDVFAAPIDVNVVAGNIAGAMGPAGPLDPDEPEKHDTPKKDTPEETDDTAVIDEKIKDLINEYTLKFEQYDKDLYMPLFDPNETIKNIVQAIDLQNRNITSLRGLRTLMLGMPLSAKQLYYNKLLETYNHMKEFYEPEDAQSSDDEKGPKSNEDRLMDMLTDILTVLHMTYPDTKEREIINIVRNQVKQYPEQKQIPNDIDDINDLVEYITNTFNINDLEDLKRDVEDLVRAGEAPPEYERDMGIDALIPPGYEFDKPEPDENDDGSLNLIIQREIEKLQVKLSGSEIKVLQLLREKLPTIPANINNLDDLYDYTDALPLKSKNIIIKYINELNAKDLSGSGRKKRTNTKRKKTIRGKGLSVAELRARLKSIMN
jgi:hypothetical protein